MATIRERKTKDRIDKKTGTIIKGKTRYQAIVRLQEGTDSKAFSNKTSARKWALRVENEIRQGTYSKQQESSKHTVSELIDRYLNDHKFLKKKDQSSRKRHLNDIWRKRIGDKKLIDVSRALIIQVRDELAAEKTYRGGLRAPATVNRIVASIRHAFSEAVEWEWMDANPCKGLSSMTEPPGIVRYLSDDERKALLKATQEIDPTLHLIVVLALSTGARRGEIAGSRHKDSDKDKLGLLWSDIHWKEGFAVLRDTKNSETRGMPLTGLAMELLKEHRDSERRQLTDKLVFPHPSDRERPWNFESLWQKALKQAEIENFRFHDLRHSAASYLAMGGATPGDIAEILGHKTLQMVKRYSHLSNDHVSSVVSKMNDQIFGEQGG
jgi:integrase